MVMTMMFDEVKRALECHATDKCSVCPLNYSVNCSEEMALAALDALNTKAEPIDQRQMVLEAIRMALDKGYNVIITPTTCEIRLMP